MGTVATKAGNPAAIWNGTTWHSTNKAGNPGDYLIVEDRTKPTIWHLQVKKNGKPDHGLMGSAWAALHSGFRGNVYSGPGKGEAIAKLRKAAEEHGIAAPEGRQDCECVLAFFEKGTTSGGGPSERCERFSNLVNRPSK